LPEFERELAVVHCKARRYFPKQGPPGDHAGVERQSMRVAINLHRKTWPATTQPAHAASQDLANNYTASACGSKWWVRVCGRT
jgi:hypothetical protein